MMWNLYDSGYQGFFFIEVFKRGTRELRQFKCRMFVKKHLAGGSAPYNWKEKNLLPVEDVELARLINQGITHTPDGKEIKTPYRSANLNDIVRYSVESYKYVVKEYVDMLAEA